MVSYGSIPLQPDASVGSAAPTQESIRELARRAGFIEAGMVSLPHGESERDAARFAQWIDEGRGGSMAYLGRRNEAGELVRSRVNVPFAWAQSGIVCLAGYHADAPLSTTPAAPGAGWIARYAWSGRREPGRGDDEGGLRPSDYHKVLLKRLRRLEAELHGVYGEFECRAYVDTGPVVERSLARAAGVGWTGKNTCLIHPRLGSWNFLAVLITSLPLPVAEAPLSIPDRCGSCRRCLDACPTQALIEPYRMDATRCISYLTIEHRGVISEELSAGVGRQVFGCDICQDVCPWNRKAPIGALPDSDLAPRAALVNPSLDWLADLDEADFERLFNGSPIRRAGFLGLRRNVAIAMGNSGMGRFLPWLERWAESELKGEPETQTEPGDGLGKPEAASSALAALRDAARWAIRRITVRVLR